MIKTGKDLGVFGGMLALVACYIIFSVGVDIVGAAKLPPVSGAQEQAAGEATRGTLMVILGLSCLAGGVLGITGGAVAQSSPKAAANLMLCAAGLTFVSGFGIIAGVPLLLAALQAERYAKAPPGAEPEWQDGDSQPY